MHLPSRRFGRTSSTPKSASPSCLTGDGPVRWTIFGKKGVPANTRKGEPTPRSVLLSATMRSIGSVGDNLPARCHKSIPASFGRSRSRPTPWTTQGTVLTGNPWTEAKPAWCSPTRWAVKTATSRTFASGQNTLGRWLWTMACQPHRWTGSLMPSSTAHPASTRTRCRANWPTSFRDGWPTCLTFKGQTTPWTLRVRPPWRPCLTPAGCFKPARWTPCSLGQPTEPWTQRRLQNSLPLGPSRQPTLRRLMPVRTGSSWAKALVCCC